MVEYGGDVMLFIKANSGATEKPVAFSTTATLNVTMATRETTSKDSANWTEKLGGRFDWNVSSDALYALSGGTGASTGTTYFDELFVMFKAGNVIPMTFAVKTGTSPNWTKTSGKKYFSGEILLTSISVNASDGDNTTYSFSAEGSGELKMI